MNSSDRDSIEQLFEEFQLAEYTLDPTSMKKVLDPNCFFAGVIDEGIADSLLVFSQYDDLNAHADWIVTRALTNLGKKFEAADLKGSLKLVVTKVRCIVEMAKALKVDSIQKRNFSNLADDLPLAYMIKKTAEVEAAHPIVPSERKRPNGRVWNKVRKQKLRGNLQ